MKYRWTPRPVDNVENVSRLQQELNDCPAGLVRALLVRGVDTFDRARQFLRPSIAHLHDPFLMFSMDIAAERVINAIRNRERILVYGDYDVDGTTATALLVSFLKSIGAEVNFFIPDRFEDGYGFGFVGVNLAVHCEASLIIAVDCGITAIAQAEYARLKNIDLIICDHHTPEETIPDAVAVLNPKRSDCQYPYKELSGCGVAYKLVQAISVLLNKPSEDLREYLDLVAVSTVSDVVPLTLENRILISEGLKVLRNGGRIGLKVLSEEAGINLACCSSTNIVFSLGPRINAAGRMGNAERAVKLMLEQDPNLARELAKQLQQANNERRGLDHEMLKQASEMAEDLLRTATPHSIVLFQEDWHLGVIGIVASRLVDQFNRPTIMLSESNGILRGSARSVNGINIYEALRSCSDLLTSYGGHDYAAGVSLPPENLPQFRRRFDDAVSERFKPEFLQPSLSYDADLNLNDITNRFWAILKLFEPHGQSNEELLFRVARLRVVGSVKTVGKESEHLKFKVIQGPEFGGPPMEVVGFKMISYQPTVLQSCRRREPIDLICSLQKNDWNGSSNYQLRAQDIHGFNEHLTVVDQNSISATTIP